MAACIENSTAYVDSTGEHIWTQQLAAQWHDKALANKAIVCSAETAEQYTQKSDHLTCRLSPNAP